MKQASIRLNQSGTQLTVNYFWHANQETDLKETLLILPGLDESIADYPDFINEMISTFPQYSLLIIDLRGQGLTLQGEGKINSDKIEPADQLEIIKNITQQLGLQTIYVLGLSYGAGIALYAANRMQNIEGLYLLAPYVSQFRAYQGGLEGAWYSLAYMNPFFKPLSEMTLPLYFQLANLGGAKTKAGADALSKLSLGIMELETAKEANALRELKKGVHFLIGDKDKLVPVSAVKHLFNELQSKNKTIRVLPETGHRLLINNHSVCTEWLKTIL